MITIHKDLRFDDRHKSCLLRERRIACKVLGIGTDTCLAGDPGADRDDGTPLGEPRAQRPILSQPLAEPIQSLGELLAGVQRQLDRPCVDLDTGDDGLFGKQLWEQRPTQ